MPSIKKGYVLYKQNGKFIDELKKKGIKKPFFSEEQKKKSKQISKFLLKGSALFLKETGNKLGKKMKPNLKRVQSFIQAQIKERNGIRLAESKSFNLESRRLAKKRGKERARLRFGNKESKKNKGLMF